MKRPAKIVAAVTALTPHVEQHDAGSAGADSTEGEREHGCDDDAQDERVTMVVERIHVGGRPWSIANRFESDLSAPRR
jgi:hypothetical protein